MINKKRYIILAAGLLSAGALSACVSGKTTSSLQSTASSQPVVVESPTTAATAETIVENLETSLNGNLTPQSSGKEIGVEAAKKIALERVGVNEASVTFILTNLDMDDGRLEYDVEFYSDKTEYEISVDDYTGDITEFSGETYR